MTGLRSSKKFGGFTVEAQGLEEEGGGFDVVEPPVPVGSVRAAEEGDACDTG